MEYPLFNYVLGYSIVLFYPFLFVVMGFADFDFDNSKKLSNKVFLYFFYGVFYLGILLGIDFIILGLMSFDGWLERIGLISDLCDKEVRGDAKLWFTILMLLGPLILIWFGWWFIKEFNKYRVLFKEIINGRD